MAGGSYISIDFVGENLKTYYSESSPQNAYRVLREYLTSKGFTHLKDTNYISMDVSPVRASHYLEQFASKEKWFALSVNKVNILLINEQWDVTEILKEVWIDTDFKKEKEVQRKRTEPNLNKNINPPTRRR